MGTLRIGSISGASSAAALDADHEGNDECMLYPHLRQPHFFVADKLLAFDKGDRAVLCSGPAAGKIVQRDLRLGRMQANRTGEGDDIGIEQGHSSPGSLCTAHEMLYRCLQYKGEIFA